MSEPTIRPAIRADLASMRAIYNHEVCHGTATFDLEQRDEASMLAWFMRHGASHPILVAAEDGVALGYAALGPWIDRPAATGSAEVALYVDRAARGRGLGRRLLAAIVAAGRDAGLHLLVSRITADNDASIALHERLGFIRVGVVPHAGRKFDRWLDLAIFYRRLDDPLAST